MVCFALLASAHAMEVVRPRCEQAVNPLGIDARRPRLSWELASEHRAARQTAYRILVASSPQLLAKDQGDAWDSGKVASAETVLVAYAGRPLQARAFYWWKVRVWDEAGQPSAWSSPARWSMGLLDPSDWQASWVGPAQTNGAAVYLRREVALPAPPTRATAYIAGLGYHELSINGQRVGDHVLDPAFTDYEKRVSYVTHDVTAAFQAGANAVGVILGNGWFNAQTPDLFGFEKAAWRGAPRLRLRIDLELAGGGHRTVVSDGAWRWSTGPLTFNCIRAGESFDAALDNPGWDRPGYDDRAWLPAPPASAPTGRLAAQALPPMRVTASLAAVRLSEPRPGVYLFDFGENLTGWVRFEAAGPPRARVRLDFNEQLLPDGSLSLKHSTTHTYGRYQTGELALDGAGHGVFEPRFTYHGFRYVQVSGLTARPALASMVARRVHTDWRPAGEFSCSNPRINAVQKAVVLTLNNSCHSIPGEEATREKMGWTQDGLNTMESALYNFDAATVYAKYLQDMIDAQEPNGHVPPIIPTAGWGRNGRPGHNFSDPWWGGTLPYAAEKLYEYYGDRRALEQAYEPMRRWTDYLTSTAKGDLVDWWLGDWLEPGSQGRPKRTPLIQTSTAGYFYAAQATARAAAVLGKPDDARRYAELAARVRASFNGRFLDPASGLYAPDSQTSQALPLWLGLAPDAARPLVLARLIDNIHAWRDHVNTGFVGIMALLHGLTDWGYPDLAYTLATQPDPPGFYQMIADGNSTLSESLDGRAGSRHHPFGTCVGAWYFRALAGIRADPAWPGFAHFIIRPEAVGDLTWARGAYQSAHGQIVSAWKRDASSFSLDVTIPANTRATVYVPATDPARVTESGRPASRAEGVRFLRRDGGTAVFEVSSGTYAFASTL
jgi:alpha-L-rhamnosidase